MSTNLWGGVDIREPDRGSEMGGAEVGVILELVGGLFLWYLSALLGRHTGSNDAHDSNMFPSSSSSFASSTATFVPLITFAEIKALFAGTLLPLLSSLILLST